MPKKVKQQNKKEKEEVQGLLDPKIDYVFKRIFGHTGNEDITKALLSSIIKDKFIGVKCTLWVLKVEMIMKN